MVLFTSCDDSPLRSANTRSRRLSHLLSCPQALGLDDGRRKQLDSALFVRQSSVHQLGVLEPVEEAASDGHPGARHHVVLDQPCQGFAILDRRGSCTRDFFYFCVLTTCYIADATEEVKYMSQMHGII